MTLKYNFTVSVNYGNGPCRQLHLQMHLSVHLGPRASQAHASKDEDTETKILFLVFEMRRTKTKCVHKSNSSNIVTSPEHFIALSRLKIFKASSSTSSGETVSTYCNIACKLINFGRT